MSQHSMNIANMTRSAYRAAVNEALQALVGNNSGATEPTTTYPYMFWADTTAGWLKQRNAANDGWINRLKLVEATTAAGALLIAAADAAAQRTALGLVIGTDVQAYDANIVKKNVANTFAKPQTAGGAALTSSTTWDGSTYQVLEADVNGSAFTVAAASAVPADRTYVGMLIKYTTSHSVAFTSGAKGFAGMTGFTPTATAGKYDHLTFRYNSAADRFMLVGYAKDCGA